MQYFGINIVHLL